MRAILRVLAMSILIAVMTGTAYLAGFTTSWIMNNRTDLLGAAPAARAAEEKASTARPDSFKVFWEAWDIVRREFYGEIPDDQEMTYGAIRGMLNTLGDPNTIFIDPKTAELERTQIRGEFEGIGAVVTMNEQGQLVVVAPMEGQPAMEAGLRAGDIILAVDGKEITGMTLTDAVLLIRGPRGTTVTLTVLRPGEPEPLTFEIVRARIQVQTVSYRMLEEAPDIGYIRLSIFGNRTDQELRNAIFELRKQGAKAFIVDVRNNPGGLLSSVIDVASEFIERGVIVTERWSDGRERPFQAKGRGLLTDPNIPLVLLVNRGSASASEILAGAIRDYKRGFLVGEKTFGKGAVQQVYTLSDKSQLNVTVAHWLTPNGDDINEEGIMPDVEVIMTEEQIRAGEDVQLQRAIELLQEQLQESSLVPQS